MFRDVMLGLTVATLLVFFILALMGATVSAWWVVLWIIPALIDQVATRMFDMT